uniref:Uncharacterized protein n=1 Tax=Vitrella brassicaformis TaxID=1169539 RepID=A0A7S1KBU3_9ALVE
MHPIAGCPPSPPWPPAPLIPQSRAVGRGKRSRDKDRWPPVEYVTSVAWLDKCWSVGSTVSLAARLGRSNVTEELTAAVAGGVVISSGTTSSASSGSKRGHPYRRDREQASPPA